MRHGIVKRAAAALMRGTVLSALTASILAPAIVGASSIASARPTILSGKASDVLECYRSAQRSATPPAATLAACDAALEAGDLDRDTRAATLANRAVINRRLDRIEAAARDCEKALALLPGHSDISVTCAAVHINAGEPAAALALLRAAELPDPALRYKHYHNRALAHHDLGQYAQAYAWLERTIEARPGFAPALDLMKQYRVIRSPIAKPAR